ncbi:MAG: molecular chaperone TorD family protein [Acidobacteriota bacterium]
MTAASSAIAGSLRDCVQWRIASLALRPPAPGLGSAMAALAGGLPPGRAAAWRALAERAMPDPSLYHRLLGPGGACRPCESDHTTGPLAGKGGCLGDVAAFYKAFAFDATAEIRESPDHVSVECSFLAWLHFKEAYACHAGLGEEADTCARARERFLREHAGVAIQAVCAELVEHASGTFYADAARVIASHTETVRESLTEMNR